MASVETALDELCVWHQLKQESLLVSARTRGNAPPHQADLSAFELVHALAQQDWIIQPAPRKSKRKTIFYEHNSPAAKGPRIWYFGTQKISVNYLTSLYKEVADPTTRSLQPVADFLKTPCSVRAVTMKKI